MFIKKNIEKDSKIDKIYEDIKNYIYIKKIKMSNLRNITIKKKYWFSKSSKQGWYKKLYFRYLFIFN